MKFRMKKFMHQGVPYAVNLGFYIPKEDKMEVLMFGENEATLSLKMTVEEYNAIPYFWFEDIGEAPHGTKVKPSLVTGIPVLDREKG